MKKTNYGNFSKNAGKVLKASERVFCAVDDENNIYISNAYLIFKMNIAEYDESIRPSIPYDPGFWSIYRKEKTDEKDNKKFIDLFKKTAESIRGEYMVKYPGYFTGDNDIELVSYYSKNNFATFLNKTFVSCLNNDIKAGANSPKDIVIFYDNKDLPFAAICPIRAKEEFNRAVMSFFTSCKEESAEKNNDIKDYSIELKKENSALREVIETKEKEIIALRDELQKTKEEMEKKEESAKEESKKEESAENKLKKVMATFENKDGLNIIVNGAKTNLPVIWFSGDVQKYKKDIIQAGAAYSKKRNAYYIRIA